MRKDDTMKIDVNEIRKREELKENLKIIYEALMEKGYDPKGQIVGFIMSGDPTYITNHNNARAVCGKIDRYELLELLVEEYFEKK